MSVGGSPGYLQSSIRSTGSMWSGADSRRRLPLSVGKSLHQLFGLAAFAPRGSGGAWRQRQKDRAISRAELGGHGPGSGERRRPWGQPEEEVWAFILVVLFSVLKLRHLILELLWPKTVNSHMPEAGTRHTAQPCQLIKGYKCKYAFGLVYSVCLLTENAKWIYDTMLTHTYQGSFNKRYASLVRVHTQPHTSHTPTCTHVHKRWISRFALIHKHEVH